MSSALQEVTIRVNGKEVRLPGEASVTALLAWLEVSTPRVAVERNREIVPKALYSTTALVDGDELEVVEFVGGG